MLLRNRANLALTLWTARLGVGIPGRRRVDGCEDDARHHLSTTARIDGAPHRGRGRASALGYADSRAHYQVIAPNVRTLAVAELERLQSPVRRAESLPGGDHSRETRASGRRRRRRVRMTGTRFAAPARSGPGSRSAPRRNESACACTGGPVSLPAPAQTPQSNTPRFPVPAQP